jgi:hypothetical protein
MVKQGFWISQPNTTHRNTGDSQHRLLTFCFLRKPSLEQLAIISLPLLRLSPIFSTTSRCGTSEQTSDIVHPKTPTVRAA